MNSKLIKGLIPIAVAVLIWLLPVPEGLKPQAWTYFALFVGVVVGLIIEPVPAALVGLIGIAVACLLRVGAPIPASGVVSPAAAINWGLSGFANSTVWLIFVAFMFALGYEKTGLGKRIALILVKKLGRSTLGLGYACAIADGILAPFIPSNSARSGGTLYPIIMSIPPMFNSLPDQEPRKIGAYLVWVSLASTCVTSTMFYTGLAPNLLAMSVVKAANVPSVDWMGWFMAAAPAAIPLFFLTPLLTYWIYPPTLKGSPEVPAWAAKELEKLGPLTRNETIMGLLAVLALVLWIGGDYFRINGTTAALVVLCLMVLLGVVSWNDITANKQAWSVLAWFGTLVALASGLKNVGFLDWFAKHSVMMMSGFSPTMVGLGLVIIFYVGHYFFASTTAHVTALLALFITTAAAVPGIPVPQLALVLMLSLGFMGIITPYGTGPSPIWYGANYIKTSEFWFLGAVFGLLYLAATVFILYPWVMMTVKL